MLDQLPTPPASPRSYPPLVLCADGGGSKVCVVVRSEDGLQVRGYAGPCNVQSVGHGPAIQMILLATYRALSQLPSTHLPPDFILPNLSSESSPPSQSAKLTSPPPPAMTSTTQMPTPISAAHLQARDIPITPYPSRPASPRYIPVPNLSMPIFQYVWLGLAGINSKNDEIAFTPTVLKGLNIVEERVKITNDVNLLAAPALKLPGIKYVCAVVCGTGTVGRTIEIASSVPIEQVGDDGTSGQAVRQLPLTDVGVSKGWGWLLCDEGSAYWIGRLAIRSLLFHFDRQTRSSLYSTPPPPLLPLHLDLLSYFGVTDPMELIGIVSLIGPSAADLSIGEATAKRNAYMAGAARTVLRWAFPDEAGPPTPPASERSNGTDETKVDEVLEQENDSQIEALKLVRKSVLPMVELTMDLLGDMSVVKPEQTALALGGGLWQSTGYRSLYEEGLRKQGVDFAKVLLVSDAAGAGAEGVASVEFS